MQIVMKMVHHFSEYPTVAANCNTENQIEMRDGTVEHLPGVEHHHEALRRRADGDGAVVLCVEVVGEGLGVAAARSPTLPHHLNINQKLVH